MQQQPVINEPAPDTEQTIDALQALLASILVRIARERAAAVQSSQPPPAITPAA